MDIVIFFTAHDVNVAAQAAARMIISFHIELREGFLAPSALNYIKCIASFLSVFEACSTSSSKDNCRLVYTHKRIVVQWLCVKKRAQHCFCWAIVTQKIRHLAYLNWSTIEKNIQGVVGLYRFCLSKVSSEFGLVHPDMITAISVDCEDSVSE